MCVRLAMTVANDGYMKSGRFLIVDRLARVALSHDSQTHGAICIQDCINNYTLHAIYARYAVVVEDKNLLPER